MVGEAKGVKGMIRSEKLARVKTVCIAVVAKSMTVRSMWIRRRSPASVTSLVKVNARWKETPNAALRVLQSGGMDNGKHMSDILEVLDKEYVEIERIVKEEINAPGLVYPSCWQVDNGAAEMLYKLTRIMRPASIVETGTADGFSTRVMMEALKVNSTGHIYSFDIADNVGKLIRSSGENIQLGTNVFVDLMRLEKPYWEQLRRQLVKLAPIDLFFHDSNHCYINQMREYELAWASLRSSGVLVSDDVDYSEAFALFCDRHAVAPVLLIGDRKVVGCVVKP